MVSIGVVLAKAPSWSSRHVLKAVLIDNPEKWDTWDLQVLETPNLVSPPAVTVGENLPSFPDAVSQTTLPTVLKGFHFLCSETYARMHWCVLKQQVGTAESSLHSCLQIRANIRHNLYSSLDGLPVAVVCNKQKVHNSEKLFLCLWRQNHQSWQHHFLIKMLRNYSCLSSTVITLDMCCSHS